MARFTLIPYGSCHQSQCILGHMQCIHCMNDSMEIFNQKMCRSTAKTKSKQGVGHLCQTRMLPLLTLDMNTLHITLYTDKHTHLSSLSIQGDDQLDSGTLYMVIFTICQSYLLQTYPACLH